jgi:predicted Zn-dependent protease with MMP-like domain
MKNPTDLSELHQNIIETFEEVKKAVQKNEKRSRAGLMLGLQEIGASLDGFVGAYYPVASNIIIVNRTPLRRILETNKALLKPYIFHVLLHEYIHALGFLDEETTGQKTYEISKQQFGERHIITQLSTDIRKFFPNLVYPIHGWIPLKTVPPIELVQGFDFSNTNPYIT